MPNGADSITGRPRGAAPVFKIRPPPALHKDGCSCRCEAVSPIHPARTRGTHRGPHKQAPELVGVGQSSMEGL